MPDAHHAQHNWSGIVSTVLGLVLAYTGGIASWIVLSERTQNTIVRVTDHEERMRKLEHDRELTDVITELRIQASRLEGQITALRAERLNCKK